MFGSKKKSVLSEEETQRFVSSVAGFMQLQKIMAGRSIETTSGDINRRALGYLFGFIDGALKTKGQDIQDRSIGMPIVFEILRQVFPGDEERCLQCLMDSIGVDTPLTVAALSGNRDYISYANAKNRGEDARTPLGFAFALIEGGEE